MNEIVDYTKKETGWIKPIAKGKGAKIGIVMNRPITTTRFGWGDMVLIKKNKIVKRVRSIPDIKGWRILSKVA